MANIRVDVNYTISDGAGIVFRSPVDCSAITGLIVYYPAGDGNTTSMEFALADAHGNNVGDIDHLFAENVVVKVILDVTTGMAFVQNADTNAYIERTFIKTVNGITPDENGNVEVEVPEGGILQETDPTVPAWAKAASKPSYTASEVGALPNTTKIPGKTSELTNDSGFITGYTETDPTVPSWAKASSKPSYTKSEVGLGNVDNVKQYSASNPPPYPVTSVNGKTGAVNLDASAVGARPSTWMPSASDVGALPASTTIPTKVSQLTNDKGYLTQHQDISGKLNASELPTAINTALAQAKASGEFDGEDGQRGTGLLAVTTAPSSYTTAVGGITPKYRMALSTIKTQAGVTEVLLGDTIRYSYYHYPIDYLDASYAYFTERVSIRGATGASVTIESVSESTEDGGSNVVTFSDGKTLTVKNGADGKDGMDATPVTPLFANTVEDCTDTSKLYVLPDGYIYAYQVSGEPVPTNLFSFDNADEYISKISGSTDTAIYATNESWGYKDTENHQFISKMNSSGGRYAITGGLPAALPAGTYKASAEMYIPAGSANKTVRFGACCVPSALSAFGQYEASANDMWCPVEHTFTVASGDRYTYIAVMSHGSDFEIRWRNIKVVNTADKGTVQAQWLNTGVLFVQAVRKWLGKKWAVVGDSLTEGAGTPKPYFTYIAEATGISTVNMGNSSSGFKKEFDINTAYYQRILDVPTDTDVVTIMASGNDLSSVWNTYGLGEVTDTGTDTICGCINTTLDNLFSILPLVRVGVITPAPWDSFYPSATADPQNRMTLYSEAIVEICKQRGIPCLDLYHCSGLRPWEAGYRTLVYSNDNGGGVHPNEIGHEIMASKIKPFLETLMQ